MSSAIASLLMALATFGLQILGRNQMSALVAEVMVRWRNFKDQEFLAQCDREYNNLLESWDQFKQDREDV